MLMRTGKTRSSKDACAVCCADYQLPVLRSYAETRFGAKIWTWQ